MTWMDPIKDLDLIVHCAAYTNVEKAEENGYGKDDCFETNVTGTHNLLMAYPNVPFVYISSEYAHNPVNFYALTKSLAEQLVTTHPNYLIIRCLFKPDQWPYDNAFVDQFTVGDVVSIIAPKIEKVIKEWDFKSKMIYVGSGRKTVYDIARKSKPDVKKSKTTDIKDVKIPTDYL